MNTVAVRPRLDQCYDVIQSHAPQLVGTRRSKAEAVALAEWAAAKAAPARVLVFGPDGATIESSHDVAGTGAPRATAAAH